MKRTCLLSQAYTSAPLTLDGTEIVYSALANEILRELQTAFFCGEGPGDQSQFAGMCEGIYIMFLLATEDFQRIQELRTMPRATRHAAVLDFALAHESEIDRLKPEIIARLESTIAAAVESEAQGKSQPPAPPSSPS